MIDYQKVNYIIFYYLPEASSPDDSLEESYRSRQMIMLDVHLSVKMFTHLSTIGILILLDAADIF